MPKIVDVKDSDVLRAPLRPVYSWEFEEAYAFLLEQHQNDLPKTKQELQDCMDSGHMYIIDCQGFIVAVYCIFAKVWGVYCNICAVAKQFAHLKLEEIFLKSQQKRIEYKKKGKDQFKISSIREEVVKWLPIVREILQLIREFFRRK